MIVALGILGALAVLVVGLLVWAWLQANDGRRG
jgi:hypothetical protein